MTDMAQKALQRFMVMVTGAEFAVAQMLTALPVILSDRLPSIAPKKRRPLLSFA
jgi:hypothetical protein